MNNQNSLELIENVHYEETKTNWVNHRNPKDRFLIEFAYEKDGKSDRTRMTTNDLSKFATYLMLNGFKWQWMNVLFRWVDINKRLRIGQIASYTTRYPPYRPEPTEGEVNNTMNKLSWKRGVVEAVTAYKELVLSK